MEASGYYDAISDLGNVSRYCDVKLLDQDIMQGQCDVTVSGDITQVTNDVIVTSNIFLIVN